MLPTVEGDTPAAEPPSKMGTGLAARLPEILIQALFLLIAVVLAFAIEEWREERELDQLGEEARLAILQEVTRNYEELLESRQQTAETASVLEESLSSTGEGMPMPSGKSVNLELALLSSAAWRTAQSTEASRRMDYGWMLKVSQAYELQAMYQEAQSVAVQELVRYRSSPDVEKARELLGRIRLLSSLSTALEGDYTDVL